MVYNTPTETHEEPKNPECQCLRRFADRGQRHLADRNPTFSRRNRNQFEAIRAGDPDHIAPTGDDARVCDLVESVL